MKSNPVFLAVIAGLVFVLSVPLTHAIDISHSLKAIEPKVIAWRRDIHEHPELSNREYRTANLVAQHLRSLDFDRVDTKIAHTGVVGVLVGGKPGPVVALRADMDALPITEALDLPFASKVTTRYNGEEVGVMHACGHDAHTAILMGVAEVLASQRENLAGTVKFIFQPAEEGAPEGERGGAKLMIEEGVLKEPYAPKAIFALHVLPLPIGVVKYGVGGLLAAEDNFKIVIKGKQTHGSMPWLGIDPIVVAGQIVNAIQLIPSRQLDVTQAPAVISVGKIAGGVRSNIIPDEVVMLGTIRTLDPKMQSQLQERLRKTVVSIATASGAEATVDIEEGTPITYNDPELVQAMLPTLESVAGKDNLQVIKPVLGAEDFAYYQQHIPGFYFTIGINKPGVGDFEGAVNHSPNFYINEDGLIHGVEAMSRLAIDYLESH